MENKRYSHSELCQKTGLLIYMSKTSPEIIKLDWNTEDGFPREGENGYWYGKEEGFTIIKVEEHDNIIALLGDGAIIWRIDGSREVPKSGLLAVLESDSGYSVRAILPKDLQLESLNGYVNRAIDEAVKRDNTKEGANNNG